MSETSAEVVELVCPECGSDDIRQLGHIEASWGGRAILIDGSSITWEDDGDGAYMYWDAYEITSYMCGACNHEVKNVDELVQPPTNEGES